MRNGMQTQSEQAGCALLTLPLLLPLPEALRIHGSADPAWWGSQLLTDIKPYSLLLSRYLEKMNKISCKSKKED